MADGLRVELVSLGERRVAFLVDRACEEIEPHYDSFIPAHVNPESADQRRLGICVRGLQLNGVEMPLDAESALATFGYRTSVSA